MSVTSNENEITAIKADLQNKITFAQMSNTQKRQVIDQLFPQGVAFWYTDPKAVVGDKVFGWGDPNINGGGTFLAEISTQPAGTPTEANLNFKLEL